MFRCCLSLPLVSLIHTQRPHNADSIDDRLPADRRAEMRARYLDRTTVLEEREALALAYTEQGYSSYGVAGEIDATRGTVSRYLDRALARFGPEAILRRGDVDADLEPVQPEEIARWPDHYQEWWTDAAREHPDLVPSDVRQSR